MIKGKTRSITAKMLLVLATALLAWSSFAPTLAFASSGAKSSVGGGSGSFASASGGPTTYLNAMSSFSKLGEIDVEGHIGNAASLVGFVDITEEPYTEWAKGDSSKGTGGFYVLLSGDVNEVQSYSYAAFQGDSDTEKALSGYMRYGQFLNNAGFDKVGKEGDIARRVSGTVLTGAWVLGSLADSLMKWGLIALHATNPFGMLADGFGLIAPKGAHAGQPAFSTNTGDLPVEGYTFNGQSSGSFFTETLGGVSAWVTSVYNFFRSLGVWVVAPLIVAFAAFTTMWRAGRGRQDPDGDQRWKNVLIRLTAIVVIVPFLGMLYTVTLNTLVEQFVTGNTQVANAQTKFDKDSIVSSSAANTLMYHTLVDFEGWVDNSQLGVPADAGAFSLTVSEGGKTYTIGDETWGTLRQSAGAINGMTYSSDALKRNDLWVKGGSVELAPKAEVIAYSPTAERTDQDYISSLLSRYSAGEIYRASTFESKVKGAITDEKVRAQMLEWLRLVAEPSNFAEKLSVKSSMEKSADIKDKGYFKGEPLSRVLSMTQTELEEFAKELDEMMQKIAQGDATNADLMDLIDKHNERERQAQAAAGLTNSSGNATGIDQIPWLSDGALKVQFTPSGSNKVDGTYVFSGGGTAAEYGLSTLGMYNYLNSAFSANGISVYGDDLVASQARTYHYNVNAWGSGLLCIVNILNTGAMLFCFAVLSLAYGLGLFVSNLKRGFHALMAMPVAMMGVMASIARAIFLVLAMIAELFITLVLYTVMRDFLLALNDATINIFEKFFGTVGSGGVGVVTGLMLGTLMSVIFIALALSARKVAVGTINELVSGLIEKFTAAKPGADVKAGGGAILAGAALAGGAMGGPAIASAAGMAPAMAGNAYLNSDANADANADGAENVTGEKDSSSEDSKMEEKGSSVEGESRHSQSGGAGADGNNGNVAAGVLGANAGSAVADSVSLAGVGADGAVNPNSASDADSMAIGGDNNASSNSDANGAGGTGYGDGTGHGDGTGYGSGQGEGQGHGTGYGSGDLSSMATSGPVVAPAAATQAQGGDSQSSSGSDSSSTGNDGAGGANGPGGGETPNVTVAGQDGNSSASAPYMNQTSIQEGGKTDSNVQQASESNTQNESSNETGGSTQTTDVEGQTSNYSGAGADAAENPGAGASGSGAANTASTNTIESSAAPAGVPSGVSVGGYALNSSTVSALREGRGAAGAVAAGSAAGGTVEKGSAAKMAQATGSSGESPVSGKPAGGSQIDDSRKKADISKAARSKGEGSVSDGSGQGGVVQKSKDLNGSDAVNSPSGGGAR